MDNKATLSALVIGIIFGCASSQATDIATVNAEPTPTATAPAAPAAGALRECAIMELSSEDEVDDLADDARSIAGWTPVGGSSNGVVLCR
jgi:hypothetical protein